MSVYGDESLFVRLCFKMSNYHCKCEMNRRGAFRSKPSHLSPLARQLCDCEDLARLAVDSVETVVLKYGVNRVNILKEICIGIKFDSQLAIRTNC